MTDPRYSPGDVANGYLLTEQPDGRRRWIPAPADHHYKPGDTANGYRLTAQGDGTERWIPFDARAAAAPVAPTPAGAPAGGPPGARRPARGGWTRGKVITVVSVLSVLAFIILVGTLSERPERGAAPEADKPAATEEAVVAPEVEPEPVMVPMPAGLVGMTANDAYNALAAVGLKAVYDGEATAKVLAIAPAVAEVEAGTQVTLTVEQPPVLTTGQENAVEKGRSYLAYSGFSRSGLIGQLEYEGFSTEDATFAADFIAPDWNAEAAEQAKAYLDYTPFSRQGLIDQLVYEGFTAEQAAFGASANGY